MSIIADNITQIRQQIQAAATVAKRDINDITLVAVSKRHNAEKIKLAYAAGLTHFAENQAQEANEKQQLLSELPLTWHFIGQIQSNKTRLIANGFDWVHSIDRDKIAKRLNQQRSPHLLPLNICLQVNIDNDPNKAGITPEQLPELIQQIQEYPRLQLRGLMLIPKKTDDQKVTLQSFQRMHKLFLQLQQQYGLDTLSMGMSHDFTLATALGSTMLRIGSAIFGQRD